MATSAQHEPTAEGSAPRIVVLAGRNGAGKSTSAQRVLRGALQVDEFVNADVIARGLSQFDAASVAIEAGRVMLKRLRELAAKRATFAFETTLASRSFAHWIRELQVAGYKFHLVHLLLPSSDIAVARVQERVRHGGHDIPADVIRRRYVRGLSNMFELYLPLADSRKIVHNGNRRPCLIASGERTDIKFVRDQATWQALLQDYPHEWSRR